MLSLFTEATRRNPYPLYEQLRSAAPVIHEPSLDIYILLGYDGVKRALLDPETFSSAAAPPGGKPLEWMIFTDPPRHTKLRALIMRAFTPRAVAALEPRIDRLANELLDATIDRGEMDLVGDFAVPLPLMVIAELLGIPLEDRATFKRWADAILTLANMVVGGEAAARAAATYGAAAVEMKAYVPALLERRRAEPKDDLLTRLVEAEVDGERLTDQEIFSFFQLLLLAGSETTTNLISNAILCFAEAPEQLDRVRAEPALLPRAIEEVLRHRSPLQAVFRATKRDVEVAGQRIPAGKLTLAMIGSANRDPAQFRDPAEFDVRRDPNPHVAFGHGIHFCVGAPLARLESRIALGALLGRAQHIELASSEPWEPRAAFHVHGPTRLPIRFEPVAPTERPDADVRSGAGMT